MTEFANQLQADRHAGRAAERGCAKCRNMQSGPCGVEGWDTGCAEARPGFAGRRRRQQDIEGLPSIPRTARAAGPSALMRFAA